MSVPAARPAANFVRSAIARAENRPSQAHGLGCAAVVGELRGGLCGFSASQWSKTTSSILQILRSARDWLLPLRPALLASVLHAASYGLLRL